MIIKTSKFTKLGSDHGPEESGQKNVCDSVYKKPISSTLYKNLREKDIRDGYMLCYHYRIVSKNNVRKKIRLSHFYNTFNFEDIIFTDYNEVEDTHLQQKFKSLSRLKS